MEKCPYCKTGNLYEVSENDDGITYKCFNCEHVVSVANGTDVASIDPHDLAGTLPPAQPEQQQPTQQEQQQQQTQTPPAAYQ